MARLLILGGTGEGRALAQALHAAHPGLDVVTSVAGVTANAPALPGETRVGGFGGADGLAAYIKEQGVDFVIDATHPFAARITAHAVSASVATDTPYLRVERAAWTMPANTDVVFVPDADEAARLVARTSSAALLTIGRKDLGAFDGVGKVNLVARVIERPAPDPLHGVAQYVVARPPFTLDGEVALLREHNIDTVVTKASGGDATRAKLDAAAIVGARLVIIRRPPPPDAERVSNVEDALDWVTAHLERARP